MRNKLIKKLYKFELDVSDLILYGLFVATENDIKKALGKTLQFGQDDYYIVLQESHLHELSVSETTIDDLLEANSSDKDWTISGYNPLEYLMEYES